MSFCTTMTIVPNQRRSLWLMLLAAAVMMIGAPRASADITTGLVGHWALDEATAGPVINTGSSATSGDNGQATGASGGTAATINQPGAVGKAYQFDSTGDIVGTNLTNIVPSTGEMSIFAWIKWDTNVAVGANGRYIFDNYIASQAGRTIFQIDATGTIGFGIDSTTVHGTSNVADGDWHLVGVTRNSTGGVKLLVDGIIELSGANITTAIDTTHEWVIGRRVADTARSFQGLIDDVRVYNRVISTATDVQELYLLSPFAIPEPASMMTFIIGAGAMMLRRRK